MNKKAKNICISEMVSSSVGELIWKEAQKVLIEEIMEQIEDMLEVKQRLNPILKEFNQLNINNKNE